MQLYTEYRSLSDVPAFEPARWDGDKLLNRDALKWGGPHAVPAIGDDVVVTINNCGPGKVTGYFTMDGFLGLLVVLTSPPDWYIKQNGGPVEGQTFGTEFKPVGAN